jgi:hypothetical protein
MKRVMAMVRNIVSSANTAAPPIRSLNAADMSFISAPSSVGATRDVSAHAA